MVQIPRLSPTHYYRTTRLSLLNTMATLPHLLASFWTLAGDVHPGTPAWVSPYPLDERAEAASNAGWRGLGLSLDDCVKSVKRFGLHGVRSILQDNGIEHIELEMLMDWYTCGDIRHRSDRRRNEYIELGGELGIVSLKVGASPYDKTPLDMSRMIEEFALLCDDIAQINANVVIEYMPFSKIQTLDEALAIVRGANKTNGGVLADIWHTVRSGIDYEAVSAAPYGLIKAVELNDADAEVVGDLLNDSEHHRKACGDGSFHCTAFIEAVRRAGFSGPYYGVEILSRELRRLPLRELAQRLFKSTEAQFAAVDQARCMP